MSDSVRPHGLQPTRLLRPWDSPSKNTGVGCHFLLQCIKVKSESEVPQSCLTLSNPMDCSPPGSSVHGIFQATVLEWGAIAFSLILDSEKAMTPHSSTLALKIHRRRSLVGCSPWGCEESDTTSLPLFTFMHRRRKWQPTPLFLPGESQGRRSLVGCRQWGRTESDTTEAT